MNLLAHEDLLQLLVRHSVPFVVVGGHAVNFHGYARSTEDVDVIWARNATSEAALVEALLEANAQWISNRIDPATGIEALVPVTATYVASTRLMMLVTNYGFLDLFDYVPGMPDASVREVFEESVLFGSYRYASLDWLRRMKRAANRPRDIEDLENLA